MKLVTLLVVFVALAACGSEGESIVLTDADSTSEIHLQAGEQFEVRLESNPSTGYGWEIVSEAVPYAVELRTRDYVEPDADLVGAPGEEVFVFEAIGDADILRLEYIRSVDALVIPERVVEYIIRVDGLNLDGARLCEVLAESFPPQCGGAEIVIANPEMLVVDLEQEQSIRWTNDRVQLVGTYDGSQFMLNQ